MKPQQKLQCAITLLAVHFIYSTHAMAVKTEKPVDTTAEAIAKLCDFDDDTVTKNPAVQDDTTLEPGKSAEEPKALPVITKEVNEQQQQQHQHIATKDNDDNNKSSTTTITPTTVANDEEEQETTTLTTMDASTTSTTTTTTATPLASSTTTKVTTLEQLKETEDELREKIAEVEAEPLIFSARV